MSKDLDPFGHLKEAILMPLKCTADYKKIGSECLKFSLQLICLYKWIKTSCLFSGASATMFPPETSRWDIGSVPWEGTTRRQQKKHRNKEKIFNFSL
jgi:hypothetical protein